MSLVVLSYTRDIMWSTALNFILGWHSRSASRVHLLARHTLLRGDCSCPGGGLATDGNAPVAVETTLHACSYKYLRGPVSCFFSVSPSPNVVLATFCALAFPILYLWGRSGVWRVTGSDGARLAFCRFRAWHLNGRWAIFGCHWSAPPGSLKAYRTGSAIAVTLTKDGVAQGRH